MTIFRQDLKNNVKNEMMRDGRIIQNLKTMIKMTIDLNNKLYERIIKKQYSKRHFEQKEYYIQQRERQIRSEASRNKKRSNNTIFMKLNAVLSKKFKNKKKKSIDKKKDTTCYTCDKKSYFAKNCKSKNVV